jgi:nitrogen fixation protein FixH
MTGKFTGKHMAAILITFFAVVVAVNLLMARLASSTFGGVVVANSYVASQNYNRWLDAAAQERRLGWQASALRRADGRLAVTLSGAPETALVTATARHPLGRMPDQRLVFARDMAGTFVSNEVLPAGRWRLRIKAKASGRSWRSEQNVP